MWSSPTLLAVWCDDEWNLKLKKKQPKWTFALFRRQLFSAENLLLLRGLEDGNFKFSSNNHRFSIHIVFSRRITTTNASSCETTREGNQRIVKETERSEQQWNTEEKHAARHATPFYYQFNTRCERKREDSAGWNISAEGSRRKYKYLLFMKAT